MTDPIQGGGGGGLQSSASAQGSSSSARVSSGFAVIRELLYLDDQ